MVRTSVLELLGGPAAGAGPARHGAGAGDAPAGKGRRRLFLRRHRVATAVVLAAVLLAGGAALLYEVSAGPNELTGATALDRFRSGASPVADPGSLRPAAGVYSYAGQATEHVSVPPLTHDEGPRFPGTVTYGQNGCWELRIDYSTLHWQSSTYCPVGGNLVQTARAGWYRWNFMTISVSDTATFTCQEMAVPAVLTVGAKMGFACTGKNAPLDTGVVDMTGANTYVGLETLRIAGQAVTTLHFREEATVSGGQSGTSIADTWLAAANGLPVHGTWSTTVKSPSPLGDSTLTGSGHFTVSSLSPRT